MPHLIARHLRPAAQIFAAFALLTLLALSGRGAAGEAPPLDTALDGLRTVRSADAADRFLGSAFVWGADGAVAVTNAHVVADAAEVRLVDRHGNVQVAPVIARDPARDVAVIGLAPGGAPGLSPGPVPGLGAPVWALGAPLGAEFTVTRGMVSASARQVEAAVPLRLLQHDAAVNPGSSGGPLIDAQGRVVGMNSRIADGSRHYVGISYAIAAGDLARIVQGLVDETLIPFPKLGRRRRPVTPQCPAAVGLPAEGALVDRVDPGGLADRAGLRAGDVIAAAGGQPIATPGDLAFAVEVALPAGHLALDLLRGAGPQGAVLTFDPPEEVLALRDIGGGLPLRVERYTLAALGVTLDAAGGTRVVTALAETSPAAFAGLAEGDRFLAVNGQAMGLADLHAFVIAAPVLVLVERPGRGTQHLVIDPWDKAAGFRPVGGANVLDPSVVVF